MSNAVLILIAVAVALVATLGNYLSRRRTSCLDRLDGVEKLLKAMDDEDEHEWLALTLYDEIEESSELAFDGFMHRRVAEVVTLWRKKFPSVYADWKNIYEGYYHKNNSYWGNLRADYEKSVKLLSNGN